MRQNSFFIISTLICVLSGLAACTDPLEKAVRDAVEDGALSHEEIANLKSLYAEENATAIDSISDWAELVNILEGNSEMNRHDIEKSIYNLKTKVIVYLDNTSSMKGYALADDPRSFTNLFNAIQTYYHAQDIDIEARYVSKDDVALKVDFQQMRKELTEHAWTSKNQYTDSYQMPDLFGAISRMVKTSMNQKQEEVICFFVSDMIPSDENKKIKDIPSIVLNKSENIVSGIIDSLRPLATSLDGEKYAAALYRFYAPFGGKDNKNKKNNEGVYYKYTNGETLLHGEERPLYVLAIGNKNAVDEWNEKAESGLQNFSYEESAYVGGGIKELMFDGYVTIENDKMVIEVDENDELVEISLTKGSIPSYLPMDSTAIFATLDDKQIKVGKEGSLSLGKADAIDGCKLHIKVEEEYPAWIRKWSTDDDSELKATDTVAMKQTFFLDKIFCAIVRGLTKSDGSKYILDQSYTIEIKNN